MTESTRTERWAELGRTVEIEYDLSANAEVVLDVAGWALRPTAAAVRVRGRRLAFVVAVKVTGPRQLDRGRGDARDFGRATFEVTDRADWPSLINDLAAQALADN